MVTAASTRVEGLAAQQMVANTVEAVESVGKHLLIHFDSGLSLHTHLRMSGSWHVYPGGEKWHRPPSQARVVLRCDERLAVCFNAPVVELLAPGAAAAHPALVRLGPDVLDRSLDLAEILRRARRRPPKLALGELLLDQSVVAGIGNIWRCEGLFAANLHPWTPQLLIDDGTLSRLVASTARLMQASLTVAGRPEPRNVYERVGRPCRKCGMLIASRRQGPDARMAFWCPACQPANAKARVAARISPP